MADETSNATATDTTKKPFKGSCHCGAIKYIAQLPLKSDGSLAGSRCNCTFCTKTGFTGLQIDTSGADLSIISSPSAPGADSGSSTSIHYSTVPAYAANHKHYMCPTCGVHIYGVGRYEFEGQTMDYFTLNIATLDQPQEGLDLSKASMVYWDGLRDMEGWMKGPKPEGPWAGGLI